jgi:NADH-quinone oxidoreductase subunit N
MLLAGIGLLIVGLGFKAAVAPFHVWTPDVYEGAPTAVTAYMSVAAKAAAFAAILRVFLTAFPSLAPDWSGMLAVIAILTIVIGNTVAIAQQNIKRLLAYSSIAHAGYILVAVVAANSLGVQSVIYYTLAYTLMNLGAFAVVILLGRRGEENVMIADYAGVGYRQPLLGAAMTVFMLSLAGVPPTAGFFGKFFIFSAALQAGQYVLAVVGILGSVISVYYYLRVIYTMYMVEPSRDLGKPDRAPWATAAAAITAVGVVLLGLFPQAVIGLAQGSVTFFQ